MKPAVKLMRKGVDIMKILKIEKKLGYYSVDGITYETIDKINKEILLELVNLALENEIYIDQYNEELLKNQAHQIIYKNISEKIEDLNQRKDDFKDQSERLFLTEYEKYKQ